LYFFPKTHVIVLLTTLALVNVLANPALRRLIGIMLRAKSITESMALTSRLKPPITTVPLAAPQVFVVQIR